MSHGLSVHKSQESTVYGNRASVHIHGPLSTLCSVLTLKFPGTNSYPARVATRAGGAPAASRGLTGEEEEEEEEEFT